MQSWQIGNVKITKIVEMEVAGGSRFILPDATREACLPIEWLKPNFMTEDGRLIMSIHALVVETPDRRIVIDTCIGNDKQREIPNWTNLQGPFLKDMADAGYPVESIDTVMCTHMHVDHVGWNTMLVDGQWVPTFKNARYLIAQPEFDYWSTQDEDEVNKVVFSDSVKPVFDAGLVDLIDVRTQICPEVRLIPTHGHTPGHVSVMIESEGAQAMITGDFVHHPCQMARNHWCSTADYDREAAMDTRTEVFDRFADTPTLIIGTHFAGVTAGRLVRDGDAFRLDV